ncbi:MAG: CBS domain-containing protein [Pirellulales bacterium]
MDIELNLHAETVDRTDPVAPLCVSPLTPVRRVLAQLRDENRGAVLVCRETTLLGIFTERDALRLMACGGGLDEPVERFMTRQPVTVDAHETVGSAIKKMSAGGYRHLPVVAADGEPSGIVKVSGIIRYLVEHFPKFVYNQPPLSPAGTQQAREGA